ncbi:MAG TPA: CBS domain-containing protein [Planctomycetota bacterium]|jgi:acetoin utilization protein AcuB|nr:CBS domain-containing protein [Planctomycetota bacterium]
MFVRNWMSAPAVVVSPIVPAGSALSFMEKRGIRRLPVVEDDRLVGIVTRSDLLAALGKDKAKRRGEARSIEGIMTRKPVTVEQEEALERAAELMLQKKVSGLPVVDGSRVVGIITESDVFRALCQILGVGEKGARVIMSVKDDEDVLAAVRKRLTGLGMRSLATYHNPTLGRWEVVLRVRGRVAAGRKS